MTVVATLLVHSPPDDGAGAPSAYGEGGVTAHIRRGSTAFREGRWQGLSGMQGNLHVPFLDLLYVTA